MCPGRLPSDLAEVSVQLGMAMSLTFGLLTIVMCLLYMLPVLSVFCSFDMRTKEKGRRRVTTGVSLECPDVCTPLKGMQHSDIHTPGKSQRNMNETAVSVTSTGENDCTCQPVINTDRVQGYDHVLPNKGLKGSCANVRESCTLKRKPSQIYALPQPCLPNIYTPSAMPLCDHEFYSSKRPCNDYSYQPSAANAPENLRPTDKPAAHGICLSAANHPGFLDPLTPAKTDKGKRKVCEDMDPLFLYELLPEILAELDADDVSAFNEQYHGSYCNSSSFTATCAHTACRFNESLPIRQATESGQNLTSASSPNANENPNSMINDHLSLSQESGQDITCASTPNADENATSVTNDQPHLSQAREPSSMPQIRRRKASQVHAGLNKRQRVSGIANNRPRARQPPTNARPRTRQENFENHGQGLRPEIVQGLIHFLDEHNELVKVFRTARDKIADSNVPDFKINVFGVVGSRQYDMPSGDAVAAIVFEGGPDVRSDYDVIIQKRGGYPQRINKLHPQYMSLQFLLFFIYGEPGYHLGLTLLDTTNETSEDPKKMSMKMYYAYQLHDRPRQYNLITRGTADTAETIQESSKAVDTSKQIAQPVNACEPTQPKETADAVPIAAILPAKATSADQQIIAATPPEQVPVLPDPSKGKYGPRKSSVRRSLFSEEDSAAGQSSSKKSKKVD
ncbi:hypothetical protein CTI12_AA369170 [Artemisia annua]|uniref:Helitron helicase-like domain-containing protein n=1 Tax=Artemisia annua TaxID=35608 RepID=A0A2U1MJW1_ARTAN|nr:hypothetical protein CTI12_AA369170 [Artemisia annua]